MNAETSIDWECWEVEGPPADFADRVQSYLDLSPRLHEDVPRIDSVDLRFGDNVFVKPGVRDPGAGIRESRGPHPGSRTPARDQRLSELLELS